MDNNEKIFSSDPQKYFIVVTEWNYPVESGRDVDTDYDTKEEAVERCKELCEQELPTFSQVCGKPNKPILYHSDGTTVVRITHAGGDIFLWFAAKVIEVEHGMPMNVMNSTEC